MVLEEDESAMNCLLLAALLSGTLHTNVPVTRVNIRNVIVADINVSQPLCKENPLEMDQG